MKVTIKQLKCLIREAIDNQGYSETMENNNVTMVGDNYVWCGDRAWLVVVELDDGTCKFIHDHPTKREGLGEFLTLFQAARSGPDTGEGIYFLGPFEDGDILFVNEELGDEFDTMGWQRIIRTGP